MASQHADIHGEPRLADLVGGIIADAQRLIRQEVQLAQVEIKQELNKTKNAAISFGAGAGLMVWSTVLLTLAAVFLVGEFVPLWVSFAIFGGIAFMAGVIVLYVAKTRAEDIHVVPPQTVETLQENLQWIRNRG
jgi:hypothetical protein